MDGVWGSLGLLAVLWILALIAKTGKQPIPDEKQQTAPDSEDMGV